MKKSTIITGCIIIGIGLFMRLFEPALDIYIYGGIIFAGVLLILIGFFVKKENYDGNDEFQVKKNNSKKPNNKK